MHGTLVKAVCRKPTSVGVSDDDVIVVCECMQTIDFVELEKRHTVVTRDAKALIVLRRLLNE